MTIGGGSIGGWFGPYDNSQVTIYGGHRIEWLDVSSQVRIVGSDFGVYRYDENYANPVLVFSGYGDLTSSFFDPFDPFRYSLRGTLANGDLLEVSAISAYADGQISLVPLPGAVLLGAIGLSVAGWRLRRQTR